MRLILLNDDAKRIAAAPEDIEKLQQQNNRPYYSPEPDCGLQNPGPGSARRAELDTIRRRRPGPCSIATLLPGGDDFMTSDTIVSPGQIVMVNIGQPLPAPAAVAKNQWRPAIVVEVWGEPPSSINAVVFLDGSNDGVFSGSAVTLTSWTHADLP